MSGTLRWLLVSLAWLAWGSLDMPAQLLAQTQEAAQPAETTSDSAAPPDPEAAAPKVQTPIPAIPAEALRPEEIQGVINLPENAAFEAKLDELKSEGKVTEQIGYEIRLLRAWQRKDVPALKKLATEEQLKALKYDITASAFFSTEAQVKSLLALLQGVIAAEEGDEPVLKARAADALWLYPEHAGMVGELITAYQRTKAMAKLTLPMETRLTASGGEHSTLAELARGKKALLLYFWASWSAPSVEMLPGLNAQAGRLLPQGIVLAGVNTEGNATKAEETSKSQNITMPWLLEPERKPLVSLLEIDDVPRMALITPAGKVLYNGHPDDVRLQTALKDLGIEL